MKFYYSILSLLLLVLISAKWTKINTSPATLGKLVTSASEQRLDDPIPAPIQRGSIRLRLKQIASGLTAPNWAVPAPNDPEHLYVSDQDGKLWRINLTTNNKEVFLDFSDLLVPLGAFGGNSFDERGFLGFAFHPQFVENGLLYTYTSEPAGEESDFSTIPPGASPNHRSVIREWRLTSSNSNQVQDSVEEMRVLLTVDQPQFNHNAGALNFGSDGNVIYCFRRWWRC